MLASQHQTLITSSITTEVIYSQLNTKARLILVRQIIDLKWKLTKDTVEKAVSLQFTVKIAEGFEKTSIAKVV